MKKTTKKMAMGGSIVALKNMSKAVDPAAKAVQKAAPAKPAPAPAPTIAQKAAPIANNAIAAMKKLKFKSGGMAKGKC